MNIGFYVYVTAASHPTLLNGRADFYLRREQHKELPYGICQAHMRLFCLDLIMSDYELSVLWKGTIEI